MSRRSLQEKGGRAFTEPTAIFSRCRAHSLDYVVGQAEIAERRGGFLLAILQSETQDGLQLLHLVGLGAPGISCGITSRYR